MPADDATWTIDARNVEEEEKLDGENFVRRLHEPPSPQNAQRSKGELAVIAPAMIFLTVLGIATLPHPLTALVGALGAGLAIAAAMFLRRRRRPVARDTRDRFTLRMSSTELVVSAERCPPRVIALDRIDRFAGDDRLRVQMRDGTTAALPCALTPAENAALADSMTEALARTRADAADYRGDRVRVANEEEAEVVPAEDAARARR